MFKAEVIDRYMHCILQIFFKKNAQNSLLGLKKPLKIAPCKLPVCTFLHPFAMDVLYKYRILLNVHHDRKSLHRCYKSYCDNGDFFKTSRNLV